LTIDLTEPSAVETWVDLPPYVEEPFEVFVNGIPHQAGVDFELRGRALVFPRELVPEVQMSKLQWVLVSVGIGAYKKHDSVDVIYQRDGRRLVASTLPVRLAESRTDVA
jgi:hypothetical protein